VSGLAARRFLDDFTTAFYEDGSVFQREGCTPTRTVARECWS